MIFSILSIVKTDKVKLMFRVLFGIAIIGIIFYQIYAIGGQKIWEALPTDPLYYVLIVLMQLILPAGEALVYGKVWSLRFKETIGVMLHKGVINTEFLGYAGEVYLINWARKKTNKTLKSASLVIKDNTVASLIAIIIVIGVILGLMDANGIPLPFLSSLPQQNLIIAGIVVSLVIAAGWKFRKSVFYLPAGLIRLFVALHVVRIGSMYLLLLAQWIIFAPEISIQVWTNLLIGKILLDMIPGVPMKDVVFAGASIGFATQLAIPPATLAALTVSFSVVVKAVNLIIYLSTIKSVTASSKS